jgi:hypothetical protein
MDSSRFFSLRTSFARSGSSQRVALPASFSISTSFLPSPSMSKATSEGFRPFPEISHHFLDFFNHGLLPPGL